MPHRTMEGLWGPHFGPDSPHPLCTRTSMACCAPGPQQLRTTRVCCSRFACLPATSLTGTGAAGIPVSRCALGALGSRAAIAGECFTGEEARGACVRVDAVGAVVALERLVLCEVLEHVQAVLSLVHRHLRGDCRVRAGGATWCDMARETCLRRRCVTVRSQQPHACCVACLIATHATLNTSNTPSRQTSSTPTLTPFSPAVHCGPHGLGSACQQ